MTEKNLELKNYIKNLHKKDKRKDGFPYINHLFRVADSVYYLTNNKKFYNIALFHDSIEMQDCAELRNKLKKIGIFDEVLILTHYGSETYDEYIERVASYPEMIIIKICDIIDNLCNHPTEKQKEKYKNALIYLLKKS